MRTMKHGTRYGYAQGCRRPLCPLPEGHDCTHAQMVSVKRYRIQGAKSVPSLGAARRLQALVRIGWTQQDLADMLGLKSRESIGRIVRQKTKTIQRSSHLKVIRLYDRLSMTPGTSEVSRAHALRQGWLSPLEWDDEHIDDLGYTPAKVRPRDQAKVNREIVDRVLVQRALNGVQVDANKVEKVEVIRRWLAAGWALNELERIQGWNVAREKKAIAA